MAVHDGSNIRSRLVDLAMNETFEKTPTAIRIEGVAVQIVIENVVGCDQCRRERARHEITLRRRRIAKRHVAERVHNALYGQDAAGGGEIRDEGSSNRGVHFFATYVTNEGETFDCGKISLISSSRIVVATFR